MRKATLFQYYARNDKSQLRHSLLGGEDRGEGDFLGNPGGGRRIRAPEHPGRRRLLQHTYRSRPVLLKEI